jgi:hypothetical protein
VKELLVYCCMWIVFTNLCDSDTGCVANGVSRWCDGGNCFVGYTVVVHSVNSHT